MDSPEMRRDLVVAVRAGILRWWHEAGVRAEGRVALGGGASVGVTESRSGIGATSVWRVGSDNSSGSERGSACACAGHPTACLRAWY